MTAMKLTIEQCLHDEATDAYGDWHKLCHDVQAAYDRWARAAGSHAGIAFRQYQDALVREENASLKYALLVGSLVH